MKINKNLNNLATALRHLTNKKIWFQYIGALFCILDHACSQNNVNYLCSSQIYQCQCHSSIYCTHQSYLTSNDAPSNPLYQTPSCNACHSSSCTSSQWISLILAPHWGEDEITHVQKCRAQPKFSGPRSTKFDLNICLSLENLVSRMVFVFFGHNFLMSNSHLDRVKIPILRWRC